MVDPFVGEKGFLTVEFMDIKILTWNVRGMGNRDKRMAICKGFVGAVIQETKIEAITDQIVADIWGSPSKDWVALPSWGASRGILLI